MVYESRIAEGHKVTDRYPSKKFDGGGREVIDVGDLHPRDCLRGRCGLESTHLAYSIEPRKVRVNLKLLILRSSI